MLDFGKNAAPLLHQDIPILQSATSRRSWFYPNNLPGLHNNQARTGHLVTVEDIPEDQSRSGASRDGKAVTDFWLAKTLHSRKRGTI